MSSQKHELLYHYLDSVIDLENYEEAWRPDLYIQPERLHPFDLPTFIPNGNPVARFEVYSIRFTLYQYYNKIYRYLTSALRYSNSKLLHRVLRDTRMSVLVKLRYLEAEDTAYMTDRSRMTNWDACYRSRELLERYRRLDMDFHQLR
ncbi:hypothetical protein BGX33_006069 [Mortierella sp. NVP41]|nr:hypothetical protein BGX33_006069 [Mortierella sp. NVP41]